MKLCNVNPHVRFASVVNYQSENNPVRAVDCRLFYVLSGSAEIFIDETSYNLAQDTVFYCCGGSCYNIKSTEGISLICINFDLTQKDNNIMTPFSPQKISDTSISSIFVEISDSEFLNSHIFIACGREFYNIFTKLTSEFSENKLYHSEMCSSFLKELIIMLHRAELPKKTKIDAVISYINNNFSKNITNKELAELAGYHEYHLNRLFLKYTGTSMHSYILHIRINEAKQLLINTELTLTEICEKIGFNNYTYFSRYFKQIVNLTPFQYRKSLKNKI